MEMTLIAPNQGKNGATTRMEGDPTAALEDDNGNGRKRHRNNAAVARMVTPKRSRHPDRNDDGHGDGHDEAGLIEADAENDADARDAVPMAMMMKMATSRAAVVVGDGVAGAGGGATMMAWRPKLLTRQMRRKPLMRRNH